MSPPRHSDDAITNADELQQDAGYGDGAIVETNSQKIEHITQENGPDTSLEPASQNAHPGKEHDEGLNVHNAQEIARSTDSTAKGEPSAKAVPSPTLIGNFDAQAKEKEHSNLPGHPNEEMESSIATLKPRAGHSLLGQTLLNPSTANQAYLDPTPKTPTPSLPPSRSSSSASAVPRASGERSPTRSDAGFDEKPSTSEDERDSDSKSEIQSIMDQFDEDGGPGHEEVMSPRLEMANPVLSNSVQHPPRKSSLDPLGSTISSTIQNLSDMQIGSPSPGRHSRRDSDIGPAVPPKPGSIHSFNPGRTNVSDDRFSVMEAPMSPSSASLHRPPPPEPEPEPDLPFDFHRFLEQLRHKTADPVAKFLRSFLLEFGKKQWMVHEQVKIIGDFLAFITNKMGQCEVWREVSDAEFDNAREGMEKLVMNRLYTQTFSPAIPPPQPIPGARPKRKGGERPLGPGRKGQHQEDVERDDILAQKVGIYGWVKEEHLDIAPVGESGKRFLVLAQQELLKIKTYRAPRDKIICVLNCCKVIFGLLKHAKSDSSADSFMPLLIYVVLQANPEHLVSNVQYILRFRNQDKLGGEAGYYLSSLLGAVQFIENLDRTSLTISDEDFEKHVEAAVSAIAEKHQAAEARTASPVQLSEKSAPSHPEVTPRHSTEGESSQPRKSTSSRESDEPMDEKAAISGLLKSIQKPLSSIGKMFLDEGPSSQSGHPVSTPLPGNTPRGSPSPRPSYERPQSSQRGLGEGVYRRQSAEDAAARQASAEVAEAHRVQRAEHETVVDTLAGMFPDLDREIISDVVHQKEGRVGLAVDACLAFGAS